MQRVRMSLPYYRNFGWDVEVVAVNPKFIEGFKDEMLLKTIPRDIIIHQVNAFPAWLTRKIGLGSLSIRALLFYFFKVNSILKNSKFDLIFFSTTMFHVGVLGPYWKKRFNVPFVVDLQDPWRNDFYLDKPRCERPPKFLFAYTLLKWSEAFSIPRSDGLMSVSEDYLLELKTRYKTIRNLPMSLIPFGSSGGDFEFLSMEKIQGYNFRKHPKLTKNVVYIGAITPSFIPVIRTFFDVLIKNSFCFSDYHFYFLGTSYSVFKPIPLIRNLALEMGINEYITEVTERIPYFQTLATLKEADLIFIPGSIDESYNASKVYNAILSRTPIFSIFHNKSEVKKIIEFSNAGVVIGFNDLYDLQHSLSCRISEFQNMSLDCRDIQIPLDILASGRTKAQCDFFNQVIEKYEVLKM
jgi:hypothetical protein